MKFTLVAIVMSLSPQGEYTNMELFETYGLTQEQCYAQQGESYSLRNGIKATQNLKDIEKVQWAICKPEHSE